MSQFYLEWTLVFQSIFRRTLDVEEIFNHMVQKAGFPAFRCLVVYLFLFSSRSDESAETELSQVMRDSRTAHSHQRGNVEHAFLSVTENIEKFHPHRIAELLQHLRYFLKILTGGKAVFFFIFDIPARLFFYAIHILHINIKQWLLEYDSELIKRTDLCIS